MVQQQQGHPIFAALWGLIHGVFNPVRRDLIAEATGRVLEVGAGAGANLPFYTDRVSEIVLVEPDPYMRQKAAKAISASGKPATLIDATAESLPFEDDRFDTVVATLVFCSVTQPGKALAEIYRVLKPTGRFIFLEHVRSERPVVARLQDWLTPVNKRLFAGCHLNRQTIDRMSRAGFKIHRLRKPYPRWPVFAGMATVC